MCDVILTVGPRASGKSSFSERAATLESGVVLVSRDKFLVEMFGSTDICPYTGGHFAADEAVWNAVRGSLLRFPASSKLILDTWNGSSEERRSIVQRLRNLGAKKITAWYFTTPVEFVEEWFWKKPGIAKISEMRNRQGQGLTFYSEDAPRRDYEMFQKLASGIRKDGFNQVVNINPLTTEPNQVLVIPAKV